MRLELEPSCLRRPLSVSVASWWPRPGGPVSCLQKGACWSEAPFRGPSWEVFSLTPLYSQESFFRSLSPVFFVLSWRERTKTKYPCSFTQRPLRSHSASVKCPDLAGLPPHSRVPAEQGPSVLLVRQGEWQPPHWVGVKIKSFGDTPLQVPGVWFVFSHSGWF